MAAASAPSASTGSGADDSASPATKPRLPSWVYKMPRNAYDEGVCKRRVEWSYTHGKTMPPSHFGAARLLSAAPTFKLSCARHQRRM